MPISDRTVKNILDLGRLGIAVYFPQGISRIRVLHVSITELGQDHRLVANESCTLHGIAPDDRPFVPCFLFRILELRQSASVMFRFLLPIVALRYVVSFESLLNSLSLVGASYSGINRSKAVQSDHRAASLLFTRNAPRPSS